MDKKLGNIEYHRGWVQEKNPEPDKLHNKFAWAEKNGVYISIGPQDLGESRNNNKRRLFEMFFDDDEDKAGITSFDVKDLFKQELFHNSDAYSSDMKRAMAFCIQHLHESAKPDYTGLTSLIEFLEKFIKTATALNESAETDKVKLAVESLSKEARMVAQESIRRGVAGGCPDLNFAQVEKHLADALKLYISALKIAKNTNDERAHDYNTILIDIKDAIDAAFEEIKDHVIKANSTSQLKIYHGFGDEKIVYPEELTAEYYAKNFLNLIK